jgi:3-isopropylmalate dehydrogenase
VYKIAVIPGDGTGPEVTAEAVKVLGAAANTKGIKYETTHFDFGGDRYLKTNEVLPESAVKDLSGFDAILLGAIGHPDVKPGILEKGILLRLRFELDLYINLRPVKLYEGVDTPLKDKGPEHIDFVVVRENTEGLRRRGGSSRHTPEKWRSGIHQHPLGAERCLRYAFELPQAKRPEGLTLCGKECFDLYASTCGNTRSMKSPRIIPT